MDEYKVKNLKDILINVMTEYPPLRKYKNNSIGHPNLKDEEMNKKCSNYLKNYLNKKFKNMINDFSEVKEYNCSSIFGKPNVRWQELPFITFSSMDSKFSSAKNGFSSAKNGFYPVYIFKSEGEGVYLVFSLGAGQFRENDYCNKDELDNLKKFTRSFKNYLINEIKNDDSINFNLDQFNSNLVNFDYEKDDGERYSPKRSKEYEFGTFFSKYYSFDKENNEILDKDKNILSDKDLRKDLEEFLKLYMYSLKFEDYFEEQFNKLTSGSQETLNIQKPINLNVNEEDIFNLSIDQKTLYKISASLNANHNVILNGVPGTGKTHLAKVFAQNAMGNEGFILTTATSDWTTFDTIGGLMPNEEGILEFHEGKFLEAIRKNKWLIIDEINRADIDKAFGQLFTVLSGQDVELPYKIKCNDNKYYPVKIKNDNNSFSNSYSNGTYYIGRNWRIIATMNNYDKDNLYEMSYAFMRRFMFIDVDVPKNDTFFNKWEIDNKPIFETIPTRYEYKLKELYQINNNSKIKRQLGPAIFLDMIKYIKSHSELRDSNNKYDSLVLARAIAAYIMPQLEGLNNLDEVYNVMDKLFDDDEGLIFINNKLEELGLN